MNFKRGDQYRVKSFDWFKKNSKRLASGVLGVELIPINFTKGMAQWCGQIVTVERVSPDGKSFIAYEVNGYTFCAGMLEGLAEEEIEITEGEAALMEMMAEDPGEISDGYHTFNELYEYRLLYNAGMFNELAKQNLYDVHKSRLHSDGTVPFDNPDYFIVVAELPTGQISNHYQMKDWELFDIPEKDKANEYDGHSPKDVAERLRRFLTPKKTYPKTFEECCKILGLLNVDLCFNADYRSFEASKEQWKKLGLMNQFYQLLICRDAYWQIAGEEIGLGKSWEPDWEGEGWYVIVNHRGEIIKQIQWCANAILAFPTEEMRDEFYENFKELIEQCKELL